MDCGAAETWLSGEYSANSNEFLWLHFSRSNANSELWLKSHLSIPATFFEVMHEGQGSTNIEQADDYLIATINDVIFDFSYDASQIATLWMCIHRKFAVSARVKPLRSVDLLRLSVEKGEQFATPVYLLAHLLRDQANVLHKIEREAALRVDQIEDGLLAGRLSTMRSNLGSLRRVLVRLRRLLALEPSVLFRLLSRPPPWFGDDDANELRAATEEFSTVLSDLTALQERTKLLQEEIFSHVTQQTNRSLYLLTAVTVLALPINIIAGLMGMNVGGIPLAENVHGFWIIAATVMAIAVAVGRFAYLKQRD